MKTPEEIFAALFAVQPLQESFRDLIQPKSVNPALHHAVNSAIAQVTGDPCLTAAIYLYADDLDSAHIEAQRDEADPESAYWHGIMHRREGDFSNANYWFRRTSTLRAQVGSDPVSLTERAEIAHRSGTMPEDLLQDIREEFRNLAQIGIDRLFAVR
ncbi:MAG: hypothetical protein WCK51_09735 [Armatimonadota bacterium]